MVSILFVCMGNICRSPTAHGMFLKLLEEHGLTDKVRVDSAGTHAYHVGEPPDPRATETALRRGVDLTPLRARKVTEADFREFDYVLAMDRDNLAILESLCPPDSACSVQLFLDFAPEELMIREVPDPYYGGAQGFERVFDLVEEACRGLIAHLKDEHGL